MAKVGVVDQREGIQEMNTPEVDLVVNCYDRTYEKVLSPGFMNGLEKAAKFTFTRKTVLINNVTDRVRVAFLARELKNSGEISNWFFVADELPRALDIVGLTEKDLGRTIHYSEWALVAVTLNGSPYLCCWDADVILGQHSGWISEALGLLEMRSDVLVASPQSEHDLEVRSHINSPWTRRRWRPLEEVQNFKLGYGFSDQLFLAKRANLTKPIYKEFCIPSVAYPMSQISPIFEQRVDSYMRNHKLLRAVITSSSYTHTGNMGASYPRMTIIERARDLLIRRFGVKLLAFIFCTQKKFNGI